MYKLLFCLMLSFGVNAQILAGLSFQNGIFQYDSTDLSGSSVTMASPSISLHYGFFDNHLIGANADVHFSPTEENVSLYSVGMNYRYYFHGQGISNEIKINDFRLKTRQKWNSWGQVSLNKYSYFLGTNPSSETKFDQTGDFFNLNFGGGTDYDIGSEYRAFADFSMTLLSFASTDNRVKLRGTLISFGVAKEF